MPYRKVPIVTGEMYHVFNRGVEQRPTFLDEADCRRFYKTMAYYQNENVPTRFSFRSRKLIRPKEAVGRKMIDLICFCLMPNHFHLLLDQTLDKGIPTYLGKLTNSYTRYFNTRHKRVGHLFQAPYKAVRIESEEQLLHVSRYIHLNPLVGGVTPDLKSYKWSSYQEYLSLLPGGVCGKQKVMGYFSKLPEKNYERFVLDQADYARSLEKIKDQLLDQNLY